MASMTIEFEIPDEKTAELFSDNFLIDVIC